MMRAFESAGWPTSSVSLHGEDVVMDLFIFFVFADPVVDGFAGTYQLEYRATATPAASGGLSGRRAAAESSNRRFESGVDGVG